MKPAEKEDQYTYTDYRSWPANERWELINGVPVAMSPSPTARHQRIVKKLAVALEKHFAGKSCEVMLSPLDVKLSEDNVVQPDLMVVCNPNQVKETHVEGPPTLVAEILSPSTASLDMLEKMRLYSRFGVKEYWIVSPFPSFVTIYSLDEGSYRVAGGAKGEEKLVSTAFPDLSVDLSTVFDFPLTDEEQAITDLHLREPPARYQAK